MKYSETKKEYEKIKEKIKRLEKVKKTIAETLTFNYIYDKRHKHKGIHEYN